MLLGLAGFMVMADNWVVSPILPSIGSDLGISITRVGLLITAYMIPFGIFQIIFGPLADRYGKKQVITFSMVAFVGASGLCAIGSGLTDLALYRVLTGVFAASVMPISLALIGDTFPVEQRQGAIGMFMGISFLGQGLSMIIGGAIAYLFSWRGVFGIYAAVSVIPVVLLILNYKGIPSKKNPQSLIIRPYMKLLGTPRSLFTYLLVMLEGLFIIGSFSFIGSYISNIYHFNNLFIGLIMTAFGLMTVLGGRASGKLAARLGARKILSIGLLSAALADFIICFSGASLVLLVLGVAFLGLGFIFTHSTLLTRATEFAQKARGSAMSLVAFFFMGSGGIGTALGGKIIAIYGIDKLFLIYGIGIAITLTASFLLIRDHVVEEDEKKEKVADI